MNHSLHYVFMLQNSQGSLPDGRVVAIKELSSPIFLRDNENRLYDTINIFIELKHKNIVRPLGYCHEVKMFLVSYNGRYAKAREQRFCFIEEYMANGSMDKIINGMFLYRTIILSIIHEEGYTINIMLTYMKNNS